MTIEKPLAIGTVQSPGGTVTYVSVDRLRSGWLAVRVAIKEASGEQWRAQHFGADKLRELIELLEKAGDVAFASASTDDAPPPLEPSATLPPRRKGLRRPGEPRGRVTP